MLQEADIEELLYIIVSYVELLKTLKSKNALYLLELTSVKPQHAHVLKARSQIPKTFDDAVGESKLL